MDRHLDDHTGRGPSAETGEKKISNFFFQLLIQLDLVVHSRIFFLVNFYVINLLFKKKKFTGLGRWWTSLWMIIPGVDYRPRPVRKKILNFYFAIYIQLDLVFNNFYVIKLIKIDYFFLKIG